MTVKWNCISCHCRAFMMVTRYDAECVIADNCNNNNEFHTPPQADRYCRSIGVNTQLVQGELYTDKNSIAVVQQNQNGCSCSTTTVTTITDDHETMNYTKTTSHGSTSQENKSATEVNMTAPFSFFYKRYFIGFNMIQFQEYSTDLNSELMTFYPISRQ